MKNLFGILLSFLILSGCTKDIINDGEGSFIDDRNIYLQLFYSFNGQPFLKDSLYQAGSTFIYVDELEMVFSNFYMLSDGDTLENQSGYNISLSTLDQRDVPIARLKPGGYFGELSFLFGLDMMESITPPEAQPDYSPLKDKPFQMPIGYNYLLIKGRAFDPAKPDETSPSLNFQYAIASFPLATRFSINKSFSMGSGNKVYLPVQMDIGQLFSGIDPATVQIIKSDPTDAVDYARAELLQENLVLNAFKIQP